MPALPRAASLPRLLCASAALIAALSGCGDDASAPIAVEPARTLAQDTPPPALAPGVLGTTTDVPPARTRLAFVNPGALTELGGPLPADEIARLTLGKAGAARLAAVDAPAPDAVVQAGPTTLFVTGQQRVASGGPASVRSDLERTGAQTSLITAETPSAVQSCLGDAAAEVIVGPGVLGRMSSIGAGVVSTDDAPAGPKLLVCAAPHYARDLHATEGRLAKRFPAEGAAAGREPVVAEQEIGEREIVGAAIPLDAVKPALLRELLSGGPALTALIGH